jgi:glycosyltransferase involved in cell wall biosynthesis
VDNWNKCLSFAKGDFIVMMGDDDLLEPDYLREFTDLIAARPDLDVYHCRSKVIDDNGKFLMLTPSWPEYENVLDNIFHRITERRSQYISDFVYRTDALKQNGGYYRLPLAWGADDITAFTACSEKGIAHTNKTLFNYRSNGLSITTTGNAIIKMEANMGYEQWLEDFLRCYQPRNTDEKILHDFLTRNQMRFMKKRKSYVMTASIKSKKTANLYMWLKNRSKFGITLPEVLYSFIISLK